jgi:hypothetical protein
MVVWEKTPGKGTDYYNIYKLGLPNPIGTVPFNDLSVFIDNASSPMTQAASYAITAVDSCGNESALSDYHRTILLSTSQGVPSGVNLSWNVYEGFYYTWFYIYRGSSANNLVLIDSVAKANNSPHAFVDLNPPPFEMNYRVAVNKHPDSICSPATGKVASGPFKKSLSNIGDWGTQYDFQIKVFLEGPYIQGEMPTTLNEYGLLPRMQPFNLPPWNYQGQESVPYIPNIDIVDWILIELRQSSMGPASATSNAIVHQQAAFIKNNGDIVDLDGFSDLQINSLSSDNLYLVLWHQNHLGIISGSALQENGNTFNYDFTTGLDKVYGGLNGYKQLPAGQWGMVAGDMNRDGSINILDRDSSMHIHFGEQGILNYDLNFDGQVNNIDKNDFWVPNEGKGCMVPE